MDTIRTRAVEILEDSWPSTFNGWLRLKSELNTIRDVSLRDPDNLFNGQIVDDCTPEPASAIRIAEDYDIPTILPYAYYRLAVMPISNDWDKFRADEDLRSRLVNGERTARWTLVAPAVQRADESHGRQGTTDL